MTGLERNADIVTMCSYAPLFAHVDAWQWTPDLIWFDNLRSFGTANYYVQKLFATHKGTHLLQISSGGAVLTGQDKIYASSVWDNDTKEVILKIVNSSDEDQEKEIIIEGRGKVNPKATLIVLKSDSLEAVNSLDGPKNISPVEQPITLKGKKFNLTFPPSSLSVVRIKYLK